MSQRWRRFHQIGTLLLALAVLVPATLLLVAIPSEEVQMPVIINEQNAITRPWLGLGIEWDAETNDIWPTPLTQSQWQTLFSRVDYMRPAWIRSMINIGWFCPDGKVGDYTFDSPVMKAWYPILDYAKARNIPLMLGTWDAVPWGFYSEGYTTALTDLVQYLVKERGYTNIRYLNSLNEPDSKLANFTTWSAGAQYIQSILAKRGLASQVALVGPDTSWTNGWITESDLPQGAGSFLGAYEWHHYDRTCCAIQGGQVESYFRPIVERLAGPEQANAKPVLLGEMGWGYQSGPGDNPYHVKDYQYGIEMADFAMQIARAGVAGGSAWDLDDAMHNKVWGMWNIVSDPAPRPWFYSWAMLTRYFPAGATLYKPASPDAQLRLMAAQVANDKDASQLGWSVALLNRGTLPVHVELTLPESARSSSFNSYVYSEQASSKNTLPPPASQIFEQPGPTMSVQVPANDLLLVTNLNQQGL